MTDPLNSPAPETTPPPVTPPPPGAQIPGAEKKLVAGLLAILLGAFGVHKFYLGYKKEGIIMLLITVVSCGFAAIVSSVIGIAEGIIYLTKPDQEFVSTYVTGRKPWF